MRLSEGLIYSLLAEGAKDEETGKMEREARLFFIFEAGGCRFSAVYRYTTVILGTLMNIYKCTFTYLHTQLFTQFPSLCIV